jgi:hypothetical protein
MLELLASPGVGLWGSILLGGGDLSTGSKLDTSVS